MHQETEDIDQLNVEAQLSTHKNLLERWMEGLNYLWDSEREKGHNRSSWFVWVEALSSWCCTETEKDVEFSAPARYDCYVKPLINSQVVKIIIRAHRVRALDSRCCELRETNASLWYGLFNMITRSIKLESGLSGEKEEEGIKLSIN